MIDQKITEECIILQRSPFWQGIGAIDGLAKNLDIEEIVIYHNMTWKTALEEFKNGGLDMFDFTSIPN